MEIDSESDESSELVDGLVNQFKHVDLKGRDGRELVAIKEGNLAVGNVRAIFEVRSSVVDVMSDMLGFNDDDDCDGAGDAGDSENFQFEDCTKGDFHPECGFIDPHACSLVCFCDFRDSYVEAPPETCPGLADSLLDFKPIDLGEFFGLNHSTCTYLTLAAAGDCDLDEMSKMIQQLQLKDYDPYIDNNETDGEAPT
ncbi:hypothetical protein HK104_007000 [Borealophlyctis nickersoniae]|nr:hypothetical protein HK104_007000 [Borealophlyctis nickersoniae]